MLYRDTKKIAHNKCDCLAMAHDNNQNVTEK